MSPNKKSEFQIELDEVLKPKLLKLGFHEVVLKDCIHPEVLFNRGRLWFGASWDYRDQYLDVALGHLYWFRDVIPRVIILGDYATYCTELGAITTATGNYLNQIAEFVRDTFENAIYIYETRYEEILEVAKNPKEPKYRKEFLKHLGKEVLISDLERFLI